MTHDHRAPHHTTAQPPNCGRNMYSLDTPLLHIHIASVWLLPPFPLPPFSSTTIAPFYNSPVPLHHHNPLHHHQLLPLPSTTTTTSSSKPRDIVIAGAILQAPRHHCRGHRQPNFLTQQPTCGQMNLGREGGILGDFNDDDNGNNDSRGEG